MNMWYIVIWLVLGRDQETLKCLHQLSLKIRGFALFTLNTLEIFKVGLLSLL